MFFETPDVLDDEPEFEGLRLPGWAGPNDGEMGAIVPVERVIARSANVAIAIAGIRAYRTGCMFNVEIPCRRNGMPADEWWDLHTSAMHSLHIPITGDGLPDRLLRFGIRLPDGSKATTLDRRPTRDEEPPAGPLLAALPFSFGGSGPTVDTKLGLWLWPTPPAEPFEFAVEWPAGGIPLTIAELDGAAIAAAAERSGDYWA